MQRKYLNSAAKTFEINYPFIFEKLIEYGNNSIKKGSLLTILIGSLARGDYTPFSDADVIIITDIIRSEVEFMDPYMPIDIEPRVFTINEIYEMAKGRRKIIEEIIKNSKILAGNYEIFNNLIKLYKID